MRLYVCTGECWYDDHTYTPGRVVTEANDALRCMPQLFEEISEDDERAVAFRRERQFVEDRLAELEQQDAEREQRERRAEHLSGRLKEEAFWRETADFLMSSEAEEVVRALDEIEAAEVRKQSEAEARMAQIRREPEAVFWDRSKALAQRAGVISRAELDELTAHLPPRPEERLGKAADALTKAAKRLERKKGSGDG